jgi:hypothetical protein
MRCFEMKHAKDVHMHISATEYIKAQLGKLQRRYEALTRRIAVPTTKP